MGLGLLGLALAGQRWQVTPVAASFSAARRRTSADGVVERLLRLIDDLAVADSEGITDRIRAAARGTEPGPPTG
jgi:hypothetical protein